MMRLFRYRSRFDCYIGASGTPNIPKNCANSLAPNTQSVIPCIDFCRACGSSSRLLQHVSRPEMFEVERIFIASPIDGWPPSTAGIGSWHAGRESRCTGICLRRKLILNTLSWGISSTCSAAFQRVSACLRAPRRCRHAARYTSGRNCRDCDEFINDLVTKNRDGEQRCDVGAL